MFRAGVGAVGGTGVLQGDFTATAATAWSDNNVARSADTVHSVKEENLAGAEGVTVHFHANGTQGQTFTKFTATFSYPYKSFTAKAHYEIKGDIDNMAGTWDTKFPEDWFPQAQVLAIARLKKLCGA